MRAKSLGTLAMIYAIVGLQNPLPRKTMLWKGDMNVSANTSDTFQARSHGVAWGGKCHPMPRGYQILPPLQIFYN